MYYIEPLTPLLYLLFGRQRRLIRIRARSLAFPLLEKYAQIVTCLHESGLMFSEV